MEIVRILIVDDEDSNLSLLEYVLKRYNYHIDKAKNGLIALDKFVTNDYDVVLLDVMMPIMDGVETCIRMNEYNQKIPIILITALNDDETLKRGFDAGAWDYITKPWNEIDLISRIQKANKIYKAEKEIRTLYDALKREHDKQLKEIEMAVEVQNYFLPKWAMATDAIRISSTYNPSVSLGGDIFDFIKLNDNQYLIYIGDISGHGVQAALMMTAVKAILKIIIDEEKKHLELSHVVSRLNKMLAKNVFNNKFLTLLLGVIDIEKKELKFYNAGHPPFLILDKEHKTVKKADDIGVYPIGWNEKLSYSSSYESTIELNDNLCLIFYTDGVIESPCNENECLTTQGLIDLISNELDTKDDLLLPYQIKNYMKEHNYNIAYDDFTIFAVSPVFETENKERRRYYLIDTEDKNYNSVIESVQSKTKDWFNSQSINIYVENVLKGLFNYLIYDLKSNLSDTLILLEIDKQSHVLNISYIFKANNLELSEQFLKKRLEELINDPLFTSSSDLEISVFSELYDISIALHYQ